MLDARAVRARGVGESPTNPLTPSRGTRDPHPPLNPPACGVGFGSPVPGSGVGGRVSPKGDSNRAGKKGRTTTQAPRPEQRGPPTRPPLHVHGQGQGQERDTRYRDRDRDEEPPPGGGDETTTKGSPAERSASSTAAATCSPAVVSSLIPGRWSPGRFLPASRYRRGEHHFRNAHHGWHVHLHPSASPTSWTPSARKSSNHDQLSVKPLCGRWGAGGEEPRRAA